MKPLDPNSPIPLYAQLAEAIRYAIATGEIAADSLLPPLRTAAKQWRVNLHTVRRAYALLAEKGVVRTDPQRGTVVLTRGASGAPIDPVDWFVSRIVAEAYERHGIGVSELLLRLGRWGSRSGGTGERSVYTVDSAEGEAATLAAQLRARWAIAAEGWSLDRPGSPPAGVILSPLQHYSVLRARWRERLEDVHFVPTELDKSFVSRVLTSPRQTVRAVVCERDMPTAAGLAGDARRILPAGRVEVVPHVVSRAGELLSFVPDSIDAVLLPSRLWEALTPTERAHPKASELRYLFTSREVERLANDLGWIVR